MLPLILRGRDGTCVGSEERAAISGWRFSLRIHTVREIERVVMLFSSSSLHGIGSKAFTLRLLFSNNTKMLTKKSPDVIKCILQALSFNQSYSMLGPHGCMEGIGK